MKKLSCFDGWEDIIMFEGGNKFQLLKMKIFRKMLFRLKTYFYKLNTLDEVENDKKWNSLIWFRNGFKSCAAVQL